MNSGTLPLFFITRQCAHPVPSLRSILHPTADLGRSALEVPRLLPQSPRVCLSPLTSRPPGRNTGEGSKGRDPRPTDNTAGNHKKHTPYASLERLLPPSTLPPTQRGPRDIRAGGWEKKLPSGPTERALSNSYGEAQTGGRQRRHKHHQRQQHQ